MCSVLLAVIFSCHLLQFCAASGCLGSARACATLADEAGGGVGLLQHSSDRGIALATSNGHQWSGQQGICDQFPALCSEPFNCDLPLKAEEIDQMRNVRIATDDGHANSRFWCDQSSEYMAPELAAQGQDNGKPPDNGYKLCYQDRDLATWAKDTHAMDPDPHGKDAAWCFKEAICTMADVAHNATVQDGEALCNEKYGDDWKSFYIGKDGWHMMDAHEDYDNPHSRFATRGLGLLECAIGEFQCDVVLCKEIYCKDPKNVEKYGHFLKEYEYTS